jgi:twitching motility protein PilJ
MAKAQAALKPKSSVGGWFKRWTAPKPKPAARPAGVPSSTITRIPAASAPAKAERAPKPRAAARTAESGSWLSGFRMPFIGNRPATAQMQILGVAAAVLLIATAFLVYLDTTLRTRHGTYLTIVSQMQFHTQRLAKAAGLAARGQANAFPQVKDSRDQFAAYLAVLENGGTAFDVTLPPASGDAQASAALGELAKQWPASAKSASSILSAQPDLVSLSRNIEQIRSGSEEMATLAQELTGLMQQSGSTPAQVVKANRLIFFAERLGRGSAEILGSDTIDPEVPFLIGKDTNDLRDLIRGLESGNEQLGVVALRDPDARAMLGDLRKQFNQFEQNVSPILRELQKLVSARQAARQLVNSSEQLQISVGRLQDSMQGDQPVFSLVGTIVLAALLVVVLLLMAMVFLADTRRRAAEAEAENKRNQEAILRLLNEMGDLADGDLTIRAQVTEDITGAIADSMNYTIDELRTLVTGVSNAAVQVTQKTAHAQSISAELLGAAERQSKEIEETTAQVLQVSRSISEVSTTAEEGARVAQRSLAAADKGRVAVQSSITGMNDIREQIQETSKRIKRLGESSQEIGEIVELISDITEQTNVLALNAAIQAASAGEAGRGFSVVAEEVQRLAERSGEATKQIGAIVKTIQADTQDAVAAMEKSTMGVVEGAKLSDAAGQALSEIDFVTKNLAQLIQAISQATNTQVNATTKVAQNMQDILEITRQTTRGTQQAAGSIRDLAAVAQELKSSVAGFKL